MTKDKYQKAEAALPKLRRAARDQRSFSDFFEALIAVKGHAWCMDVESERRKMARLISKEVRSLLQ